LLLAGFGNGNTFLLYGALNVLFIVFFVLVVPETKGVSLEKIEANLLSGLPLKHIGQPPRGPVTPGLGARSIPAH
jgi:MFS transporter, SP family, galactose:H+ symporter